MGASLGTVGLMTGQAAEFTTLRQPGGLSGYPSRAESPHDWVQNFHASVSLAWADGIAKALGLGDRTGKSTMDDLRKFKSTVLAVLAHRAATPAQPKRLAALYGNSDLSQEQGGAVAGDRRDRWRTRPDRGHDSATPAPAGRPRSPPSPRSAISCWSWVLSDVTTIGYHQPSVRPRGVGTRPADVARWPRMDPGLRRSPPLLRPAPLPPCHRD